MLDNPYSPPKSDVDLVERGRCWPESGSILFVSRDSDLPQRCVKCNRPVTSPARQKTFYWHASGWYFLILFNILIYAIVAIFIRKKVKLSPGLCDAHKKRRTTLVLGSLAMFIVLFMAGVITIDGQNPLISIASFTGSFIALVVVVIFSRTIYPIEIHDRGARFKGCGKDFLQSLSNQRFN